MPQTATETQVQTVVVNQDKIDPIDKLHEDAKVFLHTQGFMFEGNFYETHEKEQIIFKLPHPTKIKEKIKCWLKCSYPVRNDGTVGLRLTYGAHHNSLPQHDTKTFWSDSTFSISEEDRKKVSERLEEYRILATERAKEEKKTEDAQADWCLQRWGSASFTGDHPYFVRKDVPPSDLRFETRRSHTEDGPIKEIVALVPLRNIQGKLRGLQEIYPTNRIFPGDDKLRDKNTVGKYSGCFFVFGKLEDSKPICIAEGYATAGSIFLSTNYTTLMVVSRTNIKNVVKEIKRKYKDSEIITCGDDDIDSAGNPGRTDATAIAKEFNCKLCFPQFLEGKSRDESGKAYKDFNDLMLVSGKEEVRRQVENAKFVSTEINQDSDEIEDSNNESNKSTIKARKLALINQLNYTEIVKELKTLYSTIQNAEDIAGKASCWAKKHLPGCEVIVNGVPKTITDMKALHAFYAQLEAPSQPCVIIHRSDAQPITDKDFKNRLSGEVVIVGIDDKKGHPKYMPAADFWRGNTRKQVYRKVVFTSKKTSDDAYNLFTGFGVTPIKGNCDKILAHIKDVICAGNEKNNEAFLNKAAWEIQNIGTSSRIITVLKSEEHQVGKGIYLELLTAIYGPTGFLTPDISKVTSRFNDTLKGKALISLDEALFAGDRRSADALKSLSTASQIAIEGKGIPAISLPVALNFYLSSNHDCAAFIEEADARYWILEVSPHKKGDFAYFKELEEEINNGGKEAFADYLLNLDVKGFVPQRDVPIENAAKGVMIRNSINPHDARKWLEACCYSDAIIGCKPVDNGSKLPWEPWTKGTEYQNSIFWAAYSEWQKTVKSPIGPIPTPVNKFGELLNKVGFTQRNQDKIRWRKLPDPEECLKLLAELIDKGDKK